jgi:cytochrome P450
LKETDLLDTSSGENAYPPLDYFSADFNDNFDEVVSELIENRPVVNASGTWLLSRHEDVRAAAHDWKTFSSARGVIPWDDSGAHLRPTALDPPLHGLYRQPFQKLFSPRAVAELEPLMREEARALIGSFREKGSCDVALDFARRYIGDIFFAGILGLAPEVAQRMLVLIYGWLLPPYDEKTVVAMAEYGREVEAILRSQLDEPNRTPVMDALLTLEVNGEPVSMEEKSSTCQLLIVGGLETTVNSIIKALLHLSTHPDTLAELVNDPSLIPPATEEFLRMFSPVVGLGRTLTRDIELHGQPMKKGEKVMLGFGTASRDPRAHEDPMTIDIHRQEQGHVIFGSGVHRCLGSHLARLEIKVAIEEFLSAIPSFRLDPDSKPHWDTGMNRDVSNVRVLFD